MGMIHVCKIIYISRETSGWTNSHCLSQSKVRRFVGLMVVHFSQSHRPMTEAFVLDDCDGGSLMPVDI